MSFFKGVNVVSITVVNWEQAKKFYAEVLGWPVAMADENIGWMEFGGENEAHVSISRWRGPEMIPNKGRTTLVLTVDDAQQTTRELRAKGIHCDNVVVIPGVVAFGAFYDPEGTQIQFASPPPKENE